MIGIFDKRIDGESCFRIAQSHAGPYNRNYHMEEKDFSVAHYSGNQNFSENYNHGVERTNRSLSCQSWRNNYIPRSYLSPWIPILHMRSLWSDSTTTIMGPEGYNLIKDSISWGQNCLTGKDVVSPISVSSNEVSDNMFPTHEHSFANVASFLKHIQELIANRGTLVSQRQLEEYDHERCEDGAAYVCGVEPTGMTSIRNLGTLLAYMIKDDEDRTGDVTMEEGTKLVEEKIVLFNGRAVPDVSIEVYLARLKTFFACSAECFILATIYMDRLVRYHEKRIELNAWNVHRIFMTALLLAVKFIEDVYYSNKYYAKVGGVSLTELSSLECSFLRLIRYDLCVSPREYERYRSNTTTTTKYGFAFHQVIPFPMRRVPIGASRLYDQIAVRNKPVTN